MIVGSHRSVDRPGRVRTIEQPVPRPLSTVAGNSHPGQRPGDGTDAAVLGMYGTRVDGELERQSAVYRTAGPVSIPPARQQTSLPDDRILHSGNAGIVMHRTGQMVYDLRSEARQFG